MGFTLPGVKENRRLALGIERWSIWKREIVKKSLPFVSYSWNPISFSHKQSGSLYTIYIFKKIKEKRMSMAP